MNPIKLSAILIFIFGTIIFNFFLIILNTYILKTGNLIAINSAKLKSDVADIKNIGGPIAGAITAGKFLSNFINYPWIHLDIAGPAYVESNYGYRGKGATGTGVRLLYNFIKNF